MDLKEEFVIRAQKGQQNFSTLCAEYQHPFMSSIEQSPTLTPAGVYIGGGQRKAALPTHKTSIMTNAIQLKFSGKNILPLPKGSDGNLTDQR